MGLKGSAKAIEPARKLFEAARARGVAVIFVTGRAAEAPGLDRARAVTVARPFLDLIEAPSQCIKLRMMERRT
jgi:hypothetical protein